MSTRCLIGYQKENGEVESVYCHFDGYLSGVGKMLVDNYVSENKIQELIMGGDFSSLEKDISDIRYYGNKPRFYNSEYQFVDDADPLYHEYLYKFVSHDANNKAKGRWQVSRGKSIEVEGGYKKLAYYYTEFTTLVSEGS
tara:strand:+ start:56 stop:475 length:420 start_codon:yes stop_codon:yes gene_type:complete